MPGSKPPASKPPSPQALAWMERLVWILVYGGLLTVSLGLFLRLGGEDGHLLGTVLIIKGGIATAAGVVLIALRARWP